jgi:hypothetical protein
MSEAGDNREEEVFPIHRTASFNRKLEMLRRSGGTGSMAAEKADEIMRGVALGKNNVIRRQFRFTRNGEYRIRNCMKYDLGCGYRLVCIRKKSHDLFIYIGSHDDCCRWIDRNKGRLSRAVNAAITARAVCNSSTADFKEALKEDEYEARLMSRIDDKILRIVFSGLVNNSSSA